MSCMYTISVLNVQLLLSGLSKYNGWMLKMFRKKIEIQTKLPTSHYYILRTHIVE